MLVVLLLAAVDVYSQSRLPVPVHKALESGAIEYFLAQFSDCSVAYDEAAKAFVSDENIARKFRVRAASARGAVNYLLWTAYGIRGADKTERLDELLQSSRLQLEDLRLVRRAGNANDDPVLDRQVSKCLQNSHLEGTVRVAYSLVTD